MLSLFFKLTEFPTALYRPTVCEGLLSNNNNNNSKNKKETEKDES